MMNATSSICFMMPIWVIGIGNEFSKGKDAVITIHPRKISLDAAVSHPLQVVERPDGFEIRGIQAVFARYRAVLLKGYRATAPSDIRSGRDYWQDTYRYRKTDSMTMQLQVAVVIDAET